MDNILIPLVICCAITTLATEAMKNQLGNYKIPNNVLCGAMSIIVSVIISIGYTVLNHISFNIETLVSIVALILLNWLCAMTSYDKVIQTINQINKTKLR